MKTKTKIAVAGIGYVGLSIATLLAQNNEVVLVDVVKEKVEKVNSKISPIQDEYIEKFFKEKELDLVATLDAENAYKDADFIVVATPTNYDSEKNFFDTKYVEQVIDLALKVNKNATIVIKSTVPVGYTESVRKKFNAKNILFSPEFLRESKALEDNLYPSRIIVGTDEENSEKAHYFATLLVNGAIKKGVSILLMGFTEAEAVKLFANTYLALRISYFNELDTYASSNGLNTKSIIDGICLDPRIGDYYNNPSFGYGGYCLPKDTKQLRANYKNIPQNLITSVVESNSTRKVFIAESIMEFANSVMKKGENRQLKIGIFKLAMKSNSDNFRESSILSVMELLKQKDVHICIYEPSINKDEFLGYEVIKDFEKFKNACDVIVANRFSDSLNDVAHKVFTRDLFKRD